MPCSISVKPNECMVDTQTQVIVRNLHNNQGITVYAKLQSIDGGSFESFAHYRADCNGTVDISSEASLGGSYIGVEPMGIFCNMKASSTNKQSQMRFFVRNVEKPVRVHFLIFDTHLDQKEIIDSDKLLVQTSVLRWFKAPSVKRIPVRWKRVRGTLFIPEGIGPFPTLVDVLGTGGGLIEYRASLLASRGFMCLALAYFDHDDLTKEFLNLDLSYFEEAKDFLEALPESNMKGIGIIGLSLGGMIALACATYIPGYTCAAIVSGPAIVFLVTMSYKGRVWNPKYANLKKVYVRDGAIVMRQSLDECYDPNALGSSFIDFDKSAKSFLFIYGEDDMVLNTEKTVSYVKGLAQRGKGAYRIKTYPGTGHIIDPPHIPFVLDSYHGALDSLQRWGGVPNLHSEAEEQSWWEVLKFFKDNLEDCKSML